MHVCLVLLLVHSRLHAVRLEVELLTYVPARVYRSPDHVGRVMSTYQGSRDMLCHLRHFSWDRDTIW